MAPVRKQTPDEIENTKIWLSALEDADTTRWERDFVESLSDDFTNKGSLTERQYDKLEEVYRRHF